MDVIFEYHNVKSSPRLEEFAKEKLTKLGEKNDMVIRSDVFFKSENNSNPEKGKICSIRLSLPGPRLFAESDNDTFMASIAEALEEIERQLRKRKEKMKGR